MAGAGHVKAAGAEAMKRSTSAARHSTDVLHQRSKLPLSPVRMAVGGFAFAVTLGFFVLYSKKKPEASAVDVAKVVTGISNPDNTHPRN